MKNLSLVRSPKQDDEQKLLQKIIRKKRAQLIKITEKFEMLKSELEMVKYDYDIRIGGLYLKDNQLDLEIIQYKNIQRLMEEGLSYADAYKKVEDTYYSEQIRLDKEQEAIDEERQVLEGREEVSEDVEQDMRKLWKKLIAKYHPDLVINEKEKERRENIMKNINKAYSENNYEALKLFESQLHIEHFSALSMDILEATVVELEKSIVKAEKKYEELLYSQWYSMKIRLDQARKKGIDIFRGLEKSLLDDILRKIDILKKLKKEMGVSELL